MERDTILVVDNDNESVGLIRSIFHTEYKIVDFGNGKDAVAYLAKGYKHIALIILEKELPDLDGLVILKVLDKKGLSKLIPILATASSREPQLIAECYNNGAADFVRKPLIPAILKGRVGNLVELYQDKVELELKVNQQMLLIKNQNNALKTFNDRIIEVMSSLVEFRNLESGNHIKRIKAMTQVMCEMMEKTYPGDYPLEKKDIEVIVSASALHDIGKIAISDTILLKPGRLTADEFEVIKSHTTLGCEFLNEIQELQDDNYLKVSYNICRHHHERYDGKGYPDNLFGEAIPIEAQIVSIVDAYEALVGERVYRDAFDKSKAFDMIKSGQCGMFSKKLLDVFEKSRPLLEEISDRFSGE